MTKVPLHFTAKQDNSSVSLLCFDAWEGEITDSWCEFEYSMTGEDNDWDTYETGSVIPLNEGETVYFRCLHEKDDPLNKNKDGLCYYEDYGDGDYDMHKHHFFKMEGSIKADGNIQFLLEKTGTMMEAPIYCYYGLFNVPGNTNTALTQAPLLPATTLANNCYASMFGGCTSLTQTPELPATTLASNCYWSMFFGCTSLNNVNVNFSTWNPTDATSNWLNSVAAEGTFACPTALPEERGSNRIPEGWTIVRK
jgi:hypothetical protein